MIDKCGPHVKSGGSPSGVSIARAFRPALPGTAAAAPLARRGSEAP